MSEPTTFEIVLRGRASARLLRPLLDDFTITHTPGTHTPGTRTSEGETRLVGEVRDAAHLHGVVAHLTAVNVELVSIVPVTAALTAGLTPAAELTPEVQPEWSKS
jgi:hypothetical protein